MRLFNDGAGTVTTSVGRLEPKKYLDVPDKEAQKLQRMYATIKNAREMIGLTASEVNTAVKSAQTTSTEVDTSISSEMPEVAKKPAKKGRPKKR